MRRFTANGDVRCGWLSTILLVGKSTSPCSRLHCTLIWITWLTTSHRTTQTLQCSFIYKGLELPKGVPKVEPLRNLKNKKSHSLWVSHSLFKGDPSPGVELTYKDVFKPKPFWTLSNWGFRIPLFWSSL